MRYCAATGHNEYFIAGKVPTTISHGNIKSRQSETQSFVKEQQHIMDQAPRQSVHPFLQHWVTW